MLNHLCINCLDDAIKFYYLLKLFLHIIIFSPCHFILVLFFFLISLSLKNNIITHIVIYRNDLCTNNPFTSTIDSVLPKTFLPHLASWSLSHLHAKNDWEQDFIILHLRRQWDKHKRESYIVERKRSNKESVMVCFSLW